MERALVASQGGVNRRALDVLPPREKAESVPNAARSAAITCTTYAQASWPCMFPAPMKSTIFLRGSGGSTVQYSTVARWRLQAGQVSSGKEGTWHYQRSAQQQRQKQQVPRGRTPAWARAHASFIHSTLRRASRLLIIQYICSE
jgi:hypothetical protein